MNLSNRRCIDKALKRSEMRNIENLPEEIVLDILCRLPAKSLGRCKCVSKPWRTLISDPKFIQTHLSLINRLVNKLSLLILTERSLSVVDFDGKPPPSCAHGSVSPTRLKFQENHDWYEAHCSCNGLVLAVNSRFELFLLNPTTLECQQFPKPRDKKLVHGEKIFGFGYDSTTDDYKAVIISHLVNVDVYRFKSDTWERLRLTQLGLVLICDQTGVFLNSSLHWLGEIIPGSSLQRQNPLQSFMITVFDLADEMFRAMPLPSQYDGFNDGMVPTLGVVGGSLCVISQKFSYEAQVPGRVNVWIMKEYGVEESWIKLSLYQDIGSAYPAYFWGNDEFVLRTGDLKVAIYNVNETSARDIVICGLQYVVVQCTFVDSLLSPKQLYRGTNSLLS